MPECKHHPGYDCGDLPFPHSFVQGNKLPKRKQRNSNAFKVAQMLSIILDEPQDNAENPHEVRLEQARQMLSAWSDAQGSLMGSFREIIRLKMGFCVRCPAWPCPLCGADENTKLPV